MEKKNMTQWSGFGSVEVLENDSVVKDRDVMRPWRSKFISPIKSSIFHITDIVLIP